MSCGMFDHIDRYSFYNPHDHVDVYECANCGRIKSRDAGPRFRHTVAVSCCANTQDWTGASSVPAFAVGDTIDCPSHGPTKVASIHTTQTAGKAGRPNNSSASNTGENSIAEFGPGLAIAGIFVGGVAGLLLGWIPMLIFGGRYFLWVAAFAVFGMVSALFADS